MLLFKEGDIVPLVISPTTFPLGQDVVMRPGHAAIEHLEADESTWNPLSPLLCQCLAAEEVPFIELDDPAESRLQRGCFRRNVIAIEGIAHFEAQSIARPKADRFDPIRGPCLYQGAPERWPLGCGTIDFKPIFAGISGT